MDWNNIDDGNIPEDRDLLIYTDEKKMKVARYHSGHWDTYMKVIGWRELPKDKPDWLSDEGIKRGRKKKS